MKITIIFLGIILSILFRNLALWLGYAWFLVPAGTPELSYWHLLGVSIFIQALIHDMSITRTNRRNVELIVVSVLMSTAFIFTMFVAKLLAF